MSIIDRSSLSTPTILNFSSKDRISGNNSNFQSSPVDLGVNSYDSVCLVQASIPRSFYNVPSAYNTFTLSENGILKTVTVPAGTYNRINFATVLQASINAVASYVYTVTYPNISTQADTYKYTFTVNNVNPVRFIFTSGLFRQMGFEENSNNLFVAQSLTSTNCINLAYITRCFIKSDVCLGTNDSILEEVLNYGSFPMLSIAYYQQINFDINTRVYNPTSTNSWKFTLVDAFNQEIDLNGIPWNFSLIFFQRNNVDDLQKKEIEIQNQQRMFELEQQKENIVNEINNITTELNPENIIRDVPIVPTTSIILKEFLPEEQQRLRGQSPKNIFSFDDDEPDLGNYAKKEETKKDETKKK